MMNSAMPSRIRLSENEQTYLTLNSYFMRAGPRLESQHGNERDSSKTTLEKSQVVRESK